MNIQTTLSNLEISLIQMNNYPISNRTNKTVKVFCFILVISDHVFVISDQLHGDYQATLMVRAAAAAAAERSHHNHRLTSPSQLKKVGVPKDNMLGGPRLGCKVKK